MVTSADRQKEFSKQRFRLLFDPEQCPQVISNPDRVEQVLVILLDNAMKYGLPGGQVWVELKKQGNHAILAVANRGEPIPPEELKGKTAVEIANRVHAMMAADLGPDLVLREETT